MGILLVFTATLLLSMKGIFVKLAYNAGAGIDLTLFYRYLFSIPIVFLGLSFRKNIRFIGNFTKKEWFAIWILAFLGYYLAAKFDYTALSLIDAGISRIILFTYPAFVVGINACLRQKWPSRLQILAIGCIEIGLFLVLGGFNLDILQLNLTGALLSIGSAFCYALYIVIIERIGKNIDSQLLVAWVITCSFCYMAIDIGIDVTLGTEKHDFMLSGQAFFWIFIMAIFSTAIPLTLFASAIKRIGGSNSSLLGSISPIFTVSTAYFVLGETLTPVQLLGACIVMATIYMLTTQINQKTSHRKPAKAS